MSSSNIEIIFHLIKLSLTWLGINVFVDIKNLKIISLIYRVLIFINLIFFYFFTFPYTFFYNSQNPNTNLLDEQLLMMDCTIAVFCMLLRMILSFFYKDKYLAIFEWILNVHKKNLDKVMQNYVGAKFDKLGSRFVTIWR